MTEVAVRGSSIASKIAEYSEMLSRNFFARKIFPSSRNSIRMKALDEKGNRIKLVTDLAVLQRSFWISGVLSFESLYRSAA